MLCSVVLLRRQVHAMMWLPKKIEMWLSSDSAEAIRCKCIGAMSFGPCAHSSIYASNHVYSSHACLCPSGHHFVHPSIHPSIHPYMYPCIHPCIHPSIVASIDPLSPSIQLSIHLSIYPLIHVPIHLPVSIPTVHACIHRSVHPSTHPLCL